MKFKRLLTFFAVLMLLASTASAQTISTITVGGTDYTLFTGFTATAGNGNNWANLVDGNTSTDWMARKTENHLPMPGPTGDFEGGTEDPAFVEFHADAPIIPKGYVLTCDDEDAGFWKPVEWALKARLNEGDAWTTIHSSNTTLGAGKTFEIPCSNDGNNKYQYFRFEVYEVGATDIVDLDELQFYGLFTYTPVSARAATCTEYGLTSDGYLRSDGKYFSDENGTNELTVENGLIDKIPHDGVHHVASDSNIEYWQCSMCHKYFTDAACTHEVTADEVFKGIFGTLTAGTNGESGYYTLESKTYTLTDDVNTAGYIYVPEGVTATIDLNGHTIDRGLTSADNNGSVIIVKGTLTMKDSGTGGKIQGGYDGYADQGFYVSGIEVQNGATFNLQGGTLIGRVRDYDYTVSVVENSNFTMTGGKITGGWTGVLAVGNVTLTGGEISGNNMGVHVDENFSISGNPVITENTEMNVDLRTSGGSKINITGALTDGANIGISVRKPTDNSPVTVTSGYNTYNSVSPDTYFSLDNNGQIQTGYYDYMTVVMGWNEDRTEIAVGTALYTVNFDMNGHGDAIDAVSLLSGYKVAEPTEPTADGWYFFGWYTDDACTSQWNFNNAVTSNMTLHALWAQEAIYSFTLPEKMVIVSTTNAPVGGKYPVGTEIKFKVSSADYVVDGDVKNGDDVLPPDGDGIYTVTMGDADITITATIKKAVEPNKTLSGSESYTAQDGDVLTGSTSGTVTIASGANVTLSDVTITGGIVCAGTAEITLVGTNSVTGASHKAGIQVGGSGTTLTIKGNGSLTANGGSQSAGIGLSRAWDVDAMGGNIVIEGGNITATGDDFGAGIGTGVSYGNGTDNTATIGNITIKGGTVRAIRGTNNSYPGNGIGKGGAYSSGHAVVGTITIYDGIDMVDASSISDFANVVYKHGETNVTESKSDHFTIIENGNRRIIVQKVTPTIADVPDQTYTGSEITPEPLVLAGSLSLTKGTDYAYSYSSNTNVGTATVRATFQGIYASLGYVEKEFTILPSTVMVSVTGNGTVTYNDKSAASGETIGVTADKGTDVTLTLTPENGYAVRSVEYGYTNSNEMTTNGAKLPINGSAATLTVPNDLKDGTGVTVTVTFAPALNGGADEASAVALTDATVTDLGGGWYKVDSNITFGHTLNLLGDTHLIIADGKTMTVNTASNRGIDSDYTLTVSGAGALNVTTTSSGVAVRVGNYVQTGATVTASGYIGIRCTDDFIAFNFTNDFTFSGGQLTATGNSEGIWADNTITLGWTNPADRITTSSYSSVFGAVKIAEGNALTDGSGHFYNGILSADDLTAISGKALQPVATMDNIPDQTYTGSAITPEPTVIAGSLSLTKGTDYTYSYTNNTNVGTAKVTVTFKGDYASLGSVEKEFTIVPKSVTNNDISITIPSQVWTGSEMTPVITVKDGETTLAENTDYTVTPPSGTIQNAVNYTYTITGTGNYSGTVEKAFTIVPKVTNLGALTLTEDQNGKTAVIDGNYPDADAFSFDSNIEVASVTFNRTFTTSATSTIILPFAITEGNYSGGDFYTLKSVENNIADMTKVTSVTAHKPYLFVPNGETFSITGNVTIEATTATEYATESEDGKWEFKGIYQRKRWGAEDGDNKDYCFAANAIDDISVGEFVKIGTFVQVKPFRCYLTRKNDISKSAEQLPETIQIRFIDETASVITPDDPQENTGDITTPVSEIANNNGVKVWSYDGAIYIESAPSTAYTIVDMTGRTLKNGVTNSTRETVTLSRTAGIVIVIINGKTFKVNY